jgi:polyhydroxyalkanoate synthesis regulator phasin
MEPSATITNTDTKEKKIKYNSLVDELIKDGKLKNKAELARVLGYTKGAISELLNIDSPKYISHSFITKFEKKYLAPNTDEVDKLRQEIINLSEALAATQEVLIDSLASIMSEMKSKNITIVKQQMISAIKIISENRGEQKGEQLP